LPCSGESFAVWWRELFSVSPGALQPPGCKGFGQISSFQSDSQFFLGHIGFHGCKNQFFLVKLLFRAIKANLFA
jgi:hypothetical protein